MWLATLTFLSNNCLCLLELHILRLRFVPIMLLKLPIMLWSNALEICLVCSNYAPYMNHFALQIQHFLSLIMAYKIMNISSLSSSSTA